MNKDDFKRWKVDYCTAFPETGVWLNNLKDEKGNGQQDATLTFWFQSLALTDPNDAMEVTRRIVTGRDDPIAPFEREVTAIIVARRAKVIRHERLYPRLEQPDVHPPAKPPTGLMLGTYKALVEARRDGKDPRAVLDELMPPSIWDEQQTYRCLRCLDKGTLLVWSNQTVFAVMHRTDLIPKARQSVACDCQAGDRFVQQKDDPQKWSLCRFDPNQFCVFNGFDTLGDVETWCDAKRQSRDAAKADSFFQ